MAVASWLGHKDVWLVALVYARFVPQTGEVPGAKVAEVFGAEWARTAVLLASNTDGVSEVDLVDERSEGIDDDAAEEDPLDLPERS